MQLLSCATTYRHQESRTHIGSLHIVGGLGTTEQRTVRDFLRLLTLSYRSYRSSVGPFSIFPCLPSAKSHNFCPDRIVMHVPPYDDDDGRRPTNRPTDRGCVVVVIPRRRTQYTCTLQDILGIVPRTE